MENEKTEIISTCPEPNGWFIVGFEGIDDEELGDSSNPANRVIMDRVVAWATIRTDESDSLAPISANRHHPEDDSDSICVFGDDLAANGESWSNIYSAASFTSSGWRKIDPKIATALGLDDLISLVEVL